jgi:membrane protein implicated in regulation of membrane protease activity
MSRFLRDNGLGIVMVVLFALTLVGQVLTGHREYNDDQTEHARPEIGLGEYLTTGHFIEATFENWESEFLQMAAYVILTVFLYQRGSSESKDPDKEEEVDRDPRQSRDKEGAPGPVRSGGLKLKLYENSLFLAFALLFLLSFALHAVGGHEEYNGEQREHGRPGVTLAAYVSSSRFWFESFQNWQSEFLSVAAIVLLSVWLRQKGSPESKPVDAPHSQTGGG